MSFLDKSASLTSLQRRIILEKATEPPHSGAFNGIPKQGSYLCRRCGKALFRAEQQFSSACGWPAFDRQIGQAVAERPDADGHRTEIICQRCQAHLGHVFRGEGLTPENLRHCVNSAALDWVDSGSILDSGELIVAGGCFWGVEYHLQQLAGVVLAESGYIGGTVTHPTYAQVCDGNSGHYEAVRVLYDSSITNDESILKVFFEIHDPEQKDGQGPDRGPQYRSAVFVYNEQQHACVQTLLDLLSHHGYQPATQILPMSPFWPAEDWHQDYYFKKTQLPYCHSRVKRF
ncbi:MAG: bifunctional methionine sulfoxide reductase B/A protein [Legionellaceae bacterium]|nr:bifunctional methionine sulfoxide reductase B/A protein [Legionellaceae bacterium]